MSLPILIIAVSSLLVVARHLPGFLRQYLVDKLTAVNDLALLGKPRRNSERLCGTAIIAGGSIAGLLAARVCSDHFESVLVVEPEPNLSDYNYAHFTADSEYDSGLPKRARVAQYNAAHGYQVLTMRALKKLFPHFEDSLRAWGGRILPSDLRVHISGRLIPPPAKLASSNTILFASRHLYESILRVLVTRTCPNVRFTNSSVIDVIPSSNPVSTHNTHLSSVKIRTDGKDSVHDTTLLVDCTGMAQAGLTWLEKAGYGQCSKLRISYDPKFRGTTCHFRVPENMPSGLGAIYLYIPDPRRDIRNFYVQRVENDWLQIVCAGYGIPDRLSSFEDVSTFFGRTTPSVPLPQHIRDLPTTLLESGARPRGWQYFRLSNMSFVRYDNAASGTLPSNFVALGDAMCSMNPIHGQGATLAVVGALTLNAALSATPKVLSPHFGQSFFTRLAARLVGTWEANKCNDYGFATTERAQGDGPRYGAFHRWYGTHLAQVASHDADVSTTVWEVLNFLAPGTDMFAPSIVFKVLWDFVRTALTSAISRS